MPAALHAHPAIRWSEPAGLPFVILLRLFLHPPIFVNDPTSWGLAVHEAQDRPGLPAMQDANTVRYLWIPWGRYWKFVTTYGEGRHESAPPQHVVSFQAIARQPLQNPYPPCAPVIGKFTYDVAPPPRGHFRPMQTADTRPRVLIVEDDERLATLTQEYLSANGLAVSVVNDGLAAIQRIRDEVPDLVVLDLMLPGADGLAVCREVRSTFKNPILMLTARTDDMDQVLGLEMGADDYVAKPVKPRVLLARVRALLRRADGEAEAVQATLQRRLEFGDLVIDDAARAVLLDGAPVDLTSAEYDLLWLLASNAGKILSREEIFERLRGIPYDGQDRSIDVRISRIRPKVGDDPENPRRIKTVRSKGYLFVRDALV